MMNRALRFLSYEVRGLHTAFSVLATAAVLSSLLALVRDKLLAHTFGAGVTLDLYYAAFRIPDLIFVATGALVSVYILIPELARREEGERKNYIDTVLAGFSGLAVIVSILAAFFAPPVLALLFPTFPPENQHMLVSLTRIMLLQPILLGLSNILAALTQVRGRYALYSISPLLYNLGIIAGTVVLYPFFGIEGLAWGVVLGALLHAGIQLPSVFSDGYLHRLPRVRDWRALTRTASISIPRALALSMSQLTFIGMTALAGLLAPGSIAIFMFAFNLQAVPLSVIGASYSVAAFPTLASALAQGQRELFISHIATAARYVLFWSLPATALVIVLRAYMVRLVLGSGAFDWTDTRLTAAALAILSLSLAAQGLALLLVRGYYAAGRTFVPFIVAILTTVTTMLFAGAAVGAFENDAVLSLTQALLRVVDVPGSNVLALALSYSLVAIASTVVLIAHFERRFRGFLGAVWLSWVQSLSAAIFGGIAAYLLLNIMGPITLSSTTLAVFSKGLSAGIFGLGASALMYFMLGNREFGETVEAFRLRLWGRKVAPQPGATIVASAEESTPTGPQ